jgi:hypothetical protein
MENIAAPITKEEEEARAEYQRTMTAAQAKYWRVQASAELG